MCAVRPPDRRRRNRTSAAVALCPHGWQDRCAVYVVEGKLHIEQERHNNATMEKGVARALDSALEVAGAERAGVQVVQGGQASVCGGGVVLGRPVRPPRGVRGLCRDRWQ